MTIDVPEKELSAWLTLEQPNLQVYWLLLATVVILCPLLIKILADTLFGGSSELKVWTTTIVLICGGLGILIVANGKTNEEWNRQQPEDVALAQAITRELIRQDFTIMLNKVVRDTEDELAAPLRNLRVNGASFHFPVTDSEGKKRIAFADLKGEKLVIDILLPKSKKQ